MKQAIAVVWLLAAVIAGCVFVLVSMSSDVVQPEIYPIGLELDSDTESQLLFSDLPDDYQPDISTPALARQFNMSEAWVERYRGDSDDPHKVHSNLNRQKLLMDARASVVSGEWTVKEYEEWTGEKY